MLNLTFVFGVFHSNSWLQFKLKVCFHWLTSNDSWNEMYVVLVKFHTYSQWKCEIISCLSLQTFSKFPFPNSSWQLAPPQWLCRGSRNVGDPHKAERRPLCDAQPAWSPIMLCLDETVKNGLPPTCQYELRRRACVQGVFFLFYLIPFFLKMMALVTFSLPACQLDTAISTPSTPRPSWSVSFISKHHFTHGWL